MKSIPLTALALPLLLQACASHRPSEEVTAQMARTQAVLQQAERSGAARASLPELEQAKDKYARAQAELDKTKAKASALAASKTELEDKLQRARGDVASEMAALTSTMIKMKDDALSSANARIAELTKQLNELQSKQAAG